MDLANEYTADFVQNLSQQTAQLVQYDHNRSLLFVHLQYM